MSYKDKYAHQLAHFPIRDHFRIRGENMTRIEVFTDAAFAFAVTLLVVSIDSLPSNYEEFITALKDIPAFAASFAQLVFFWYGHRVWSQRYGLEDLKTVFISCLLIFCVLVFVFPLKISYATFFHWLSGGELPSPINFKLEQLKLFFSVFHIAFLSMCLILLWLYHHALKNKVELQLDDIELYESKTHYRGWLIMSGTALLALITTLALPANLCPFGGVLYATLGISMSLNSILRDKQKQQLIESIDKNSYTASTQE
ncbi:MAG: DUF1211 domain-containing protein [Kangiellaceae bacterium]|nr:DUF1211 domain-containing protein [Kangiellaceae bacterium]